MHAMLERAEAAACRAGASLLRHIWATSRGMAPASEVSSLLRLSLEGARQQGGGRGEGEGEASTNEQGSSFAAVAIHQGGEGGGRKASMRKQASQQIGRRMAPAYALSSMPLWSLQSDGPACWRIGAWRAGMGAQGCSGAQHAHLPARLRRARAECCRARLLPLTSTAVSRGMAPASVMRPWASSLLAARLPTAAAAASLHVRGGDMEWNGGQSGGPHGPVLGV